MKKLKVGDWVKVECLENTVARVTEIDERGVHVYIGRLMQNLYTGEFIEKLTKINISFKHFKIVLKSDGDRDVWDSMRKIRGFGRVYFTCMEEDNYIFIGYKIPNKRIVSTHVQTVEQAEAWLSLQHARTLIESKEATK